MLVTETHGATKSAVRDIREIYKLEITN